MRSPKTISILTSPIVTLKSVSDSEMLSPKTKHAPVYRVEERVRTIYVASDTDPAHWDAPSLNTLFSLADKSENNSPTHKQEHTPSSHSRESSRSSSRMSIFRPRRSGGKPASAPSSPLPDLPRKTFPPLPALPPVPEPIRQPPILFYHKDEPYYGFTNFSPDPVMYEGKRYPTSEHLFQSFKFRPHRPNLAEHIRTCSERPSVAFSEARRFAPEVRPDWKQVNIEKMDKALFYKFTQHPDLKAQLLGTGDAELIENSDKDAFWGIGADGRGRNELGRCLERLRNKLRGRSD